MFSCHDPLYCVYSCASVCGRSRFLGEKLWIFSPYVMLLSICLNYFILWLTVCFSVFMWLFVFAFVWMYSPLFRWKMVCYWSRVQIKSEYVRDTVRCTMREFWFQFVTLLMSRGVSKFETWIQVECKWQTDRQIQLAVVKLFNQILNVWIPRSFFPQRLTLVTKSWRCYTNIKYKCNFINEYTSFQRHLKHLHKCIFTKYTFFLVEKLFHLFFYRIITKTKRPNKVPLGDTLLTETLKFNAKNNQPTNEMSCCFNCTKHLEKSHIIVSNAI